MITVFWKEIRENSRWALLAFLAMAAAMFLVWQDPPLILDDPHGAFAGIIAVFTAIALGILQTRGDKHPAARALLLHRGITAEEAFAGKLLAGVAFYSFAVFAPLLALAVVLAVDGIEHNAASPLAVAPMALKSLAPFAFWPVVLLVVQRESRVLGSRLMPAVAILFGLVLCFAPLDTIRALSVFLSVLAVSLLVLLLAARSVFVNNGQVATGIGRAALALTISIAFFVMSLFILPFIESYRDASSVSRHYVVQLGPDGQPWLGREDYSQQDGRYRLSQVAGMTPGHSVRDRLQPVSEDWKSTPCWSAESSSDDDFGGIWTRFTKISSKYRQSTSESKQWEWVFDRKSDTILVYRATSPRKWQLTRQLRAPDPVGSFGRIRWHGPNDVDGNLTLITSTGVFYVPSDGTAVTLMYQTPTSSTILASAQHRHKGDLPWSIMLRMTDHIILLESNLDKAAASRAKPVGTTGSLASLYATEIQLPGELAESESLSIARDPQHEGLYLGMAQSGKSSERRIVWARFDANGRIEAQQEYTEDTHFDALSGEPVIDAFMPPAVLALTASLAVYTTDDGSVRSLWDFDWRSAWESIRKHPARTTWTALLLLLQPIVGVPLAIWAARRRRLDRRQTMLCIAWGFLMGPAGSLSVLAVYPRIVRERCLSCRRLTRIDLDGCERCGRHMDALPRIGIEIFDRDTIAGPKPAEVIGSM